MPRSGRNGVLLDFPFPHAEARGTQSKKVYIFLPKIGMFHLRLPLCGIFDLLLCVRFLLLRFSRFYRFAAPMIGIFDPREI